MTLTKTNQVLNKFTESVNTDTDYNLKDLTKLLEGIYKEFYSTRKRGTSNTSEKKAPSAYNLFIKSEIEKIKNEKLQGVDPKDYMKIAAQRWKENKK